MREKKALKDLETYVLGTYAEHYAKNGTQAIDLIIDSGMGVPHSLACVIKYAARLGKKDGATPKHDLLKMAHYCLIALVALEKNEGGENG
jgi:hypothetical protein